MCLKKWTPKKTPGLPPSNAIVRSTISGTRRDWERARDLSNPIQANPAILRQIAQMTVGASVDATESVKNDALNIRMAKREK